jgi:hypothetical protein
MTQAPKHKYAPVHHGRSDSGDAFFPDPGEGRAHTKDALAEELAEEFLSSATSGEPSLQENRDNEVTDEAGGPFITTTARQEFAKGIDASNPPGAKKEAFPTANAQPSTPSTKKRR